MIKDFKKNSSLTILVLCCFLCSACAQKEDLQSLYFDTLLSGELSEAEKLSNYKQIISSKNKYIAEAAALQSLSFNTDGLVIQRAQKLAADFSWSGKVLTRYAELLFNNKKFDEVYKIAEKTTAAFSSDDSFLRYLDTY